MGSRGLADAGRPAEKHRLLSAATAVQFPVVEPLLEGGHQGGVADQLAGRLRLVFVDPQLVIHGSRQHASVGQYSAPVLLMSLHP